MKIIKGTYKDNKSQYFEYEINNKSYWVQGELYYNKQKKRYEHEHIASHGEIYLITWKS